MYRLIIDASPTPTQNNALQYLKDFLKFGEGLSRCSFDATVPIEPGRASSKESIAVRADFETVDLTDRAVIDGRGVEPTILVIDEARQSAVKRLWMEAFPPPDPAAPGLMDNIFAGVRPQLLLRRDHKTPAPRNSREPDYVVVDKRRKTVDSSKGQFTVPPNPFVVWDCVWEAAFKRVIEHGGLA